MNDSKFLEFLHCDHFIFNFRLYLCLVWLLPLYGFCLFTSYQKLWIQFGSQILQTVLFEKQPMEDQEWWILFPCLSPIQSLLSWWKLYFWFKQNYSQFVCLSMPFQNWSTFFTSAYSTRYTASNINGTIKDWSYIKGCPLLNLIGLIS